MLIFYSQIFVFQGQNLDFWLFRSTFSIFQLKIVKNVGFKVKIGQNVDFLQSNLICKVKIWIFG